MFRHAARFVFLFMIVAVTQHAAHAQTTMPQMTMTQTTMTQTKAVPRTAGEVKLSYAPLVKRTVPAVVNIYTSKMVSTRQTVPLFNDPFFRRFFGNGLQGTVPGPRQMQYSLGSGVIIDPNGIIVTNNHVIEGAEAIKVVLHDRREYEARVIGRDKQTDLAVLKIDTKGVRLPVLALSNSDLVEVGDLVLAIGDPFGVGQTVTSGIVSALARTNIGIADLNSFIQTDAAINPGNSGGALIDMSGKLVGINTAIYSKSGGSHGIGFAIPSNMVAHVVKSLLASGRVVRPWLGAAGQNVTADIATVLGMSRPVGVLVTSLYPGGPAARAGLKVGDVVLGVKGREIGNVENLRFRIATETVGGKVPLTLLRKGKRLAIDIPLIAPPEVPKADRTLVRGRNPLAGAVVGNLSPALADELGFPYTKTGVVILKLARSGSAARLGFRPGDILRKINNRPVANVERLRGLLQGVVGGWLITLERRGRTMNLEVR